jgi:galactose mutarotase-like enzyme
MNNRYSLQNTELAVDLLPGEGGRISSLRSLRSGVEFLAQSTRGGRYAEPGPNALFQDGPCAGIEECLPTVGRSGTDTPGGPAPDHGDFWQLVWDVKDASGTSLTTHAMGFSRTLRFTKRLTLEHNTLRVDYSVENVGLVAQSFMYACHPLFAVSAGDRIVLPREIQELKLDYSRNDRVGGSGSIVGWPETRSGVRLDMAAGPGAGTAEMLYTSRLNEGKCAIYRAAANQVIQLSFDTQRLPYLGIWLCYGGWPESEDYSKQYAVALEPTTSASNTLARAMQANSAITLAPGEIFDWNIQFTIDEPLSWPID